MDIEEPAMEFALMSKEELIKSVKAQFGMGLDPPICLLSLSEFEARIEEGSYYTCDDKDHPSHRCKKPFAILIAYEPEHGTCSLEVPVAKPKSEYTPIYVEE
ncbi:hypothetical protein L6164_026204 [Bauhinia variegata]|uniref:Uncharacterized protein n=1 Tax=Bauhinia variegata TaxID=167791 RepID=A0ACB9LQ85_BAUVA|nr:hypothetical protein L6164_026204 [Bauhinia variegata]